MCVRRGLDCSYNKRLKWLNSSITGEETYVPPKLDRKKDETPKTQFIKIKEESCLGSFRSTNRHDLEELLSVSMNLPVEDHYAIISASPTELSASSQRADSSVSTSDVFDEIFDDTICSDYTSPASSHTNIITPPLSPATLATPVQATADSTILQHCKYTYKWLYFIAMLIFVAQYKGGLRPRLCTSVISTQICGRTIKTIFTIANSRFQMCIFC